MNILSMLALLSDFQSQERLFDSDCDNQSQSELNGRSNMPLTKKWISTLQHPNLPIIGYVWSILIWDSQGRDSFTEDALLSAWD